MKSPVLFIALCTIVFGTFLYIGENKLRIGDIPSILLGGIMASIAGTLYLVYL